MGTGRELAEQVVKVVMGDRRPIPPATHDQLLAVEARLGIRLPDDMRDFYLAADGTRYKTDVTHGLVRFWSLAEWTTVEDEVPKTLDTHLHGAIVVADHLDWCWGYAADFSKSPATLPFFILGGTGTAAPVANTFSEFVRLVLGDDPRIYGA